MPQSNTAKLDVLIERVAGLDKRLDAIETRTAILEDWKEFVSLVREHDTILRGPDRNDGLITQMIGLNTRIEQVSKEMNKHVDEDKDEKKETRDTIKKIVIPLVLYVITSIGALVIGFFTKVLSITIGGGNP